VGIPYMWCNKIMKADNYLQEQLKTIEKSNQDNFTDPFIEDILDDGGIPSYENVLKVMNAPKALTGESSGGKSRKRKVFY
jgi:hypothetical protein